MPSKLELIFLVHQIYLNWEKDIDKGKAWWSRLQFEAVFGRTSTLSIHPFTHSINNQSMQINPTQSICKSKRVTCLSFCASSAVRAETWRTSNPVVSGMRSRELDGNGSVGGGGGGGGGGPAGKSEETSSRRCLRRLWLLHCNATCYWNQPQAQSPTQSTKQTLTWNQIKEQQYHTTQRAQYKQNKQAQSTSPNEHKAQTSTKLKNKSREFSKKIKRREEGSRLFLWFLFYFY